MSLLYALRFDLEENKWYFDQAQSCDVISPLRTQPNPAGRQQIFFYPSYDAILKVWTLNIEEFLDTLGTMPLFDGLVSGGEKTAIVIDLGAAYTKWVSFACTHFNLSIHLLQYVSDILLTFNYRWSATLIVKVHRHRIYCFFPAGQCCIDAT